MHSAASDGSYTAEELIAMAVEAGIKTLAIADHDSVSGVRQAMPLARQHGLELLSAVELTAIYDGILVDIIGYLLDVDAPWFVEFLDEIYEKRMSRSEAMVRKLIQAGYPLTWDQVMHKSREGFVCGVHILHALYDNGYIKDEREIVSSLRDYFSREGPGYIPNNMEFRSAIEIIRMIHDLGGVAVLAHPGRYQRPINLRELVTKLGLDGLEVYYSSHTPDQTQSFEKAAADLDIISTGGSDFHGIYSKGEIRLGELMMPSNTVLQLSKCWVKRSKSKGF